MIKIKGQRLIYYLGPSLQWLFLNKLRLRLYLHSIFYELKLGREKEKEKKAQLRFSLLHKKKENLVIQL